jgi:hypothetical protein
MVYSAIMGEGAPKPENKEYQAILAFDRLATLIETYTKDHKLHVIRDLNEHQTIIEKETKTYTVEGKQLKVDNLRNAIDRLKELYLFIPEEDSRALALEKMDQASIYVEENDPDKEIIARKFYETYKVIRPKIYNLSLKQLQKIARDEGLEPITNKHYYDLLLQRGDIDQTRHDEYMKWWGEGEKYPEQIYAMKPTKLE